MNETDPSIGGRGNPNAFFADPVMDRMLAVISNLASEVWLQEERIRALEKAPSGELDAAALEFVKRVLQPLREL